MRRNYFMKSVSIILMLLAMMFSCQPVSEDVDSGNSNSNNTSQGGNTGNSTLTEGGTGIYNCTMSIDSLESSKYSNFSIFLLTDSQLEAAPKYNGDGGEVVYVSDISKTKPAYQICSYGGMVADISNSGDYAVFGSKLVNNNFPYYNGVAVTVSGTSFGVTVDMTKLVNVELKSYFNGEEKYMTDADTVKLSDYKPYLAIDLDRESNNYKPFTIELRLEEDVEYLYAMNNGATFPTNLKENTPAVPTCNELTYLYGNIVQNYIMELKNNSVTFVAKNGAHQFFFMNADPSKPMDETIIPLCAGNAEINVLDKEFALKVDTSMNSPCQINPGVLTVGNIYMVTLVVKDKHEAYVKVSEVKPTVITVNSTTHKTSYYQGDDINVANLTVEATTADGTKLTVNVTPDMISGFDSSKLGTQTVTITLNGCETTYNVEVKDIKVTEINVTASDAADKIKELTIGKYYNVKVSGEITGEIMGNICEAMVRDPAGIKETARIKLDLGNTTGLTSIGDGAFEYCRSMTGIVLPEGVTYIGYEAFLSCSSLTSVVIPDSVTKIEERAFSNCVKLTKINVSANNLNYCTSEDGKILYNKDKTELIEYLSASGDVEIPDGVITIGREALCGSSNLTSVIIPDSVKTIGKSAFSYCRSLTNVVIGSGVVTIREYAFENCESLTSITIPDSVTSIDRDAFYECGNLDKVTFEDTKGWYYTNNDGFTGGTKIDVTDDEQNATYFSDELYGGYNWYKKPEAIYISGLNGENWATTEDFGMADCMTWGEDDIYTFTFIAESINPFPYGFNFVTENGLEESYQAYNKDNPTTDYTVLQPNQDAGVYFATKAELSLPDIPDNATKFSLGSSKFRTNYEYTITFDKANMTVKVSGEFDVVEMEYITVTIVINENANLILTNVPTYNVDDMATIDGSLFSWGKGSSEALKATDCTINANWTGAEENTWVEEQAPTDTVEGADAWAKLFFSADSSQGWIPYSTTGNFTYNWNDRS